MISTKHNNGFTLMVRCKCGWITHIRCADRVTAMMREQKIRCCPYCYDNDLTFIMKKGQFKVEELKEAIKNEIYEKDKL